MDPAPPAAPRRWHAGVAVLVLLPLAKLAIHLAASGGYGYFRDEFYYLACSRHLAWGYVDQPPLSIAVLRLSTAVLGESMVAIRIPAALAGALTVFITGTIARRLGGDVYAAGLAMLCVIVAPEYLAINGYYSMNSLDVLIWTLAGWLLVSILHEGRERLWPVLGLTLGLGLLNKLSVLWLGLGLAVALLVTRERRRLLTRGPWMALAVALVVAAPHGLWQMQNAWPTSEFIRHATEDKMRGISPWDFTLAQVINLHPFTLPVWLAGLAFSLFAPAGRRVRAIGVIYLVVFVLLVVNEKSRAGYLAAAYPMLLACGGVWIASWWRGRMAWLRPVFPVLLVLGGAITAPLALTVLPPERFVAYAAALGQEPSTEENKEIGALPQFFADRFGWPELLEKVEDSYHSLTPDERPRATILTSNYGEAGALETLGAGRGLPPVVSAHNNYWLWGPGPGPADPVIVVASVLTIDRLKEACASVEDRGNLACRYCMPYEERSHVFICRGLKTPLAERWPDLKHYD